MLDKMNKPQNFVFLAFFVYSAAMAALFPRIGDVQLALGISKGELGLALVGIPAGAQISLMFGSRLVGHLGFKFVTITGIAVIALFETIAGAMPTAIWFTSALFVVGLAIGLIEIVINLEADRVEARLGKRVMNRAHAFWSFGFFASSLIGSGLAQIGVSPFVNILVVGLGATIGGLLVLRHYAPAPARNLSEAKAPRFARPSRPVLLLVAFTLSAMLMEGAGADWSVIYMRDTFMTVPLISGLALSAGALAQAVSRFFADPFVDRHGPERVAKTMLYTLGVGVCFVTFAPSPLIAMLGFALMGVGNSVIFPLAMSAAAQRKDRTAAVNVAALAQFSFIIFLLAPPILGAVAQFIDIRAAFGLGIPLVIVSLMTVWHLRSEAD